VTKTARAISAVAELFVKLVVGFVAVVFTALALLICAGILEEPENEYDTEATKKAKVLYASCVDIRK